MEIVVTSFLLSLTASFVIGIMLRNEFDRKLNDEINNLKKDVDSLRDDFTDFERDYKIWQKLKDIPLQTWQNPCADPNIPCMNPHHDCVNCPRIGSGSIGSFTSTSIETNNKEE